MASMTRGSMLGSRMAHPNRPAIWSAPGRYAALSDRRLSGRAGRRWMMVVTARASQLGPKQRGQALVEFALVFPLFLLLLFALIDVGRWVYARNSLNEATREAVRGVAVRGRPPDCTTNEARDTCAATIVRKRTFAVGGTPVTTTTCWHVTGATRTAVTLADCTTGDYLRVQAVIDPWSVLTPLLAPFLTLRIDGATEMLVVE